MSFIQALGAEALERGVGDVVPYENGGNGERGGPSPPVIEKIVYRILFHDFKYLMIFLSILMTKKFCSTFFQKYLPLISLLFSILNIFKGNKFEKEVVILKKVVGRWAFPSLVDTECQRLDVF